MAEIRCDFGDEENKEEILTARLMKPPEFKGNPLFADDRKVDPIL